MQQSSCVGERKPIHLCDSQLSRFKMDNEREAQFWAMLLNDEAVVQAEK